MSYHEQHTSILISSFKEDLYIYSLGSLRSLLRQSSFLFEYSISILPIVGTNAITNSVEELYP